jgi:hypothetical protein
VAAHHLHREAQVAGQIGGGGFTMAQQQRQHRLAGRGGVAAAGGCGRGGREVGSGLRGSSMVRSWTPIVMASACASGRRDSGGSSRWRGGGGATGLDRFGASGASGTWSPRGSGWARNGSGALGEVRVGTRGGPGRSASGPADEPMAMGERCGRAHGPQR